MGDIFGGSKTQTTVQQQTVPPYVEAAQKKLITTGAKLGQPFLKTPKSVVAPLNPNQAHAVSLSRSMADAEFDGGPTAAPTVDLRTGIGRFMNPYEQSVIDATLGDMSRQHQEALAAARARLSAGGGFGGSRQAVMESLMERDLGDRFATTAAGLRHHGFQAAGQLAGSEAGLQLQRAGLENEFENDEQRRRVAATQQLLGAGATQRGVEQQKLDVPWTVLERMRAITPGATGSTTTTTAPDNSPSGFQQLVGGGLLAASLFSDKHAKTNIEKVGTDPGSGLDIYAYDYKADVKAAERDGRPMPPKRVGPMAQDVEKTSPGTTRKVGGKLVVRGGLLPAAIGRGLLVVEA